MGANALENIKTFNETLDTEVWPSVRKELLKALDRFPPFNSAHEGYAILKEELDEMWAEIKLNDTFRAKEEAIQVAAMALRFLLEIEP